MNGGEVGDTLVVEVPLPPYALAPNNNPASKGARMAKAKRAEEYRGAVKVAAINEIRRTGWEAPARARIHLLFGLRATVNTARNDLDRLYRAEDWDNAVGAFKAGQDGLVDAGALKGDRWHQLQGGRVTASKSEGPHVIVTIEVIEPALLVLPFD